MQDSWMENSLTVRVATQAGCGLLHEPSGDAAGVLQIGILRHQDLRVPVAVPTRGYDRDVLSPERPHEPLALHGAPDQPGMPRVEPMQFRDGLDPVRLELAANAFRDAGKLV